MEIKENLKRIRVMVVDDHPAFRDGLSRLLQDEADVDVVATAGDGEQAVELASQLKPDVIVMDISIPKINGVEAAKQIKAKVPEIAILIVSAFSYQSYILAAFRAGAAGFLPKDAPLAELTKAIRLVYSGEGVFDMKVTGSLLRKLASGGVEKHKGVEELGSRELETLALTAKGLSNKAIANQLGISERTVQSHLVNIFRKLRVNSRTEAVLQGLKLGWVTLDTLPGLPEENA